MKWFVSLGLAAAGALGLSLLVPTAKTQSVEKRTVKSRESTEKSMPAKAWDRKSFAVHEWGTFTTVMGSDGSVLDGLNHDEKDLPDFVYDLRNGKYGTNIAAKGVKMETPVIYFYSPEYRHVHVKVGFPRGVVTQYYPMPSAINYRERVWDSEKNVAAFEDSPVHALKQGFIEWGDKACTSGRVSTLHVLGPDKRGELPEVSLDDHWRFSRQVDANTLRTCSLRQDQTPKQIRGGIEREYEKCLFYRGLGDFPLPLSAAVSSEQLAETSVKLSMTLKNSTPREILRHLYIVWTSESRAGYAKLSELKDSKAYSELKIDLLDLTEAKNALRKDLTDDLAATGLYVKEAAAMANTWNESYFTHEGLRVLYVIPPELIERELPLEINNFGAWKRDGGGKQVRGKNGNYLTKDYEIVRTFVGRLEVLTPRKEKEIEEQVLLLVRGNKEQRQAALDTMRDWGRLAMPWLQRALDRTKDEAVAKAIGSAIAELEIPAGESK